VTYTRTAGVGGAGIAAGAAAGGGAPVFWPPPPQPAASAMVMTIGIHVSRARMAAMITQHRWIMCKRDE
jgi:hypothetical protein